MIFQKQKRLLLLEQISLGDWQGGGFEKSYTSGRQVDTGKMSRHIQVEV